MLSPFRLNQDFDDFFYGTPSLVKPKGSLVKTNFFHDFHDKNPPQLNEDEENYTLTGKDLKNIELNYHKDTNTLSLTSHEETDNSSYKSQYTFGFDKDVHGDKIKAESTKDGAFNIVIPKVKKLESNTVKIPIKFN